MSRSAALICAILGLLACQRGEGHAPRQQVHLVDPTDRVLLVIRALDCQDNQELLARLNQLYAADQQVRGILLPGPVEEGELSRLVNDLGIAFPMSVDERQEWDRVLESLGTRGPLLVQARRGAIEQIHIRWKDALRATPGLLTLAPGTGNR